MCKRKHGIAATSPTSRRSTVMRGNERKRHRLASEVIAHNNITLTTINSRMKSCMFWFSKHLLSWLLWRARAKLVPLLCDVCMFLCVSTGIVILCQNKNACVQRRMMTFACQNTCASNGIQTDSQLFADRSGVPIRLGRAHPPHRHFGRLNDKQTNNIIGTPSKSIMINIFQHMWPVCWLYICTITLYTPFRKASVKLRLWLRRIYGWLQYARLIPFWGSSGAALTFVDMRASARAPFHAHRGI